MVTNCQDVGQIIKFLKDEGYTVHEISHRTKVSEVLHMNNKLTLNLKNKIQSKFNDLQYWKTEKTPHDLPGEGFICRKCSVALVFPL